MMLVDSSVWIDYFNGKQTKQTDLLDNTLGQESVEIGDLILTEVLQGFRNDRDFATAKQLLEAFTVFNLLGKERAIRAAAYYRTLRKRGVTVRKSSNVIIGSFCIDEGIPLLFSDRDFLPMVQHLNLQDAIARESN
ncbi:MAG: PIN domain nuclease [Synechococcus sp.]